MSHENDYNSAVSPCAADVGLHLLYERRRGITSRLKAVLLKAIKTDFSDPLKRGDFLAWLYFARQCKVSDPRDRIYALLGIANPMYGVVPDYAASERLDYIDTARQIISGSHSLYILLDAVKLGSRLPDLNTGLPSWVPDWSALDYFDKAFNIELQEDHHRYKASKRRVTLPVLPWDSSLGSNRILQVIGIHIDELALMMPWMCKLS
ncbi:hypothetical protein K469DRAFT_745770 [Zopfia rhizophila CBS 207.26]|uniref:Uncharacterized protein n=1 Tax=Zopfia rhizophila CBS 207.26 TaxID=1314779 RepID=A0A6A6EML4_9PEZI|nr:hypothetical protein K469DRAFT_745770 [Zopfia rhizophila CBS 207.26]